MSVSVMTFTRARQRTREPHWSGVVRQTDDVGGVAIAQDGVNVGIHIAVLGILGSRQCHEQDKTSLWVEQLGVPRMHEGHRYSETGDGHRDTQAEAAVRQTLEAWAIACISETDKVSAQSFTCCGRRQIELLIMVKKAIRGAAH